MILKWCQSTAIRMWCEEDGEDDDNAADDGDDVRLHAVISGSQMLPVSQL